MTPPAKKVKLDPDPIVFTIPGQKPDVRIRVFEKEFHAYSKVLKDNSAYFAKFLDPAHGIQPTSSQGFRSEWYMKVEEDGSCGITSESGKSTNLHLFKGDLGNEEIAFETFLKAIFRQPYNIPNSAVLIVMARITDEFVALGALQNSIFNAIFRSPGIALTMSKDPCGMLVAAKTLKNRVLFNDSLILAISPWSKPRYLQMEDSPLKKVAENAYLRVCMKIVHAERNILQELVVNNPGYRTGISPGSQVSAATSAYNKVTKEIELPVYYRSCSGGSFSSDTSASAVRAHLSPLLANNLILDREGVSGIGVYRDCFLCADVNDEEIPF